MYSELITLYSNTLFLSLVSYQTLHNLHPYYILTVITQHVMGITVANKYLLNLIKI